MTRTKNLKDLPVGKIMMSAAALGTIVGPFVADLNETHIFNEAWMPHAKFHTAQTMSMGVALGLATLYNLWGRGPRRSRIGLDSAVITASIYHVSQLTAGLYPGTASVDPPGADNWPQLWTTLPVLGLVGLGYLMERRRMARPGDAQLAQAQPEEVR